MSNGNGPDVRAALARIPPGVEVRSPRKANRCHKESVLFNLAPVDLEEYAHAVFGNGCPLTRDSGIGLSPYGYYPCAVAGGIDRVFGFDRGRKSLPDASDDMGEEMSQFCSLCGLFRLNYTAEADGSPPVSSSWQRAYAAWRENEPVLTRFPER